MTDFLFLGSKITADADSGKGLWEGTCPESSTLQDREMSPVDAPHPALRSNAGVPSFSYSSSLQIQ